jgi:hypothetical protein
MTTLTPQADPVRSKGGFLMEPRQSEKLVESQGEEQSSPPRPPDRKCRFQIIKLEEQIAPANSGTNGRPCLSGARAHCITGG